MASKRSLRFRAECHIITANRNSGYRDSVSYHCTTEWRKRVFVYTWHIHILPGAGPRSEEQQGSAGQQQPAGERGEA